MGKIRRHKVAITTDGSGDATAYSPRFSGKIREIEYVKTDFTDGVDFTITSEATGKTLWTEANVNAAKTCLPRGATHSNAGVASLYASGGVAVNDLLSIADDRVKIVIAQGGASKVGTFHIIVEE